MGYNNSYTIQYGTMVYVALLTFILFLLLTGRSNHSELAPILGSIGGVIALLVVAGVAFIRWKNKRKGYRRDVFVDVAGIFFDYSLN